MRQTILFLRPHRAAKSVIAAAYCQRLAAQYGLELQITTAGTEPDAAVSSAVAALLHAEGVDVTHHQPRCVSCKELAAAFRVISMGCDMSDLAPPGTIVEHWNDVSGPSAHLMAARDVIYMHVERLICGLNEPQS